MYCSKSRETSPIELHFDTVGGLHYYDSSTTGGSILECSDRSDPMATRTFGEGLGNKVHEIGTETGSLTTEVIGVAASFKNRSRAILNK